MRIDFDDLPSGVRGSIQILKRNIRHAWPAVTGVQVTIEWLDGEADPTIDYRGELPDAG